MLGGSKLLDHLISRALIGAENMRHQGWMKFSVENLNVCDSEYEHPAKPVSKATETKPKSAGQPHKRARKAGAGRPKSMAGCDNRLRELAGNAMCLPDVVVVLWAGMLAVKTPMFEHGPEHVALRLSEEYKALQNSHSRHQLAKRSIPVSIDISDGVDFNVIWK